MWQQGGRGGGAQGGVCAEASGTAVAWAAVPCCQAAAAQQQTLDVDAEAGPVEAMACFCLHCCWPCF